MGSVREITKIKNSPYYFYNEMHNIKLRLTKTLS